MTKINDSVSVGAELAARITRMNEMLTLTDAEREAIALVVRDYGALGDDDEACAQIAATLRGLLERTK
jgi:hypothetical protein